MGVYEPPIVESARGYKCGQVQVPRSTLCRWILLLSTLFLYGITHRIFPKQKHRSSLLSNFL